MTAGETTTDAPAPVVAAPSPPLTRQERRPGFFMKLWVASFAAEVVATWWAWAGPDASRTFAVNSIANRPQHAGYVLATWFNPVVITALSMLGWLDDHEHDMRRYAQMMCIGVLVGTGPQPSNRVHRPTPLRRR